jgi:hypothetical protein
MKPNSAIYTLLTAIYYYLFSGTALAQFSGNIVYQDYEYSYELKESKPRGSYLLQIATVPPQPDNRLVYQSLVTISGKVADNKKLVITVLRSSIEKEKWVLNRESLLETTFDYAQKKVFRSTKGSFAQFRTREYAEVVADDVTPQTIDIATAVRYVVEDLTVNYNRIFATHVVTANPAGAANQQGKKLSILPKMAVFPATFSISEGAVNYKVHVGAINTANRRQEIQVQIIEQNDADDVGSTSTLFTSYLIIDDQAGNGANWTVRIHFAEKVNSFTWQPYPSQFLECKFNSNKGYMLYTPGARLLPFQENKPPKVERIERTNGQITKDELLNIAVTHFIRHYSKLFKQ